MNSTSVAGDVRPRHALIAFLWATPIGVLGGLIGLGGAEFRLPVLVGSLGYSARFAVPLNLAVSLATILTAILARSDTVPAALSHLLDLVSLIAGAVAAAFLGASWAHRVSEAQLRRAIFILLGIIGFALIVEAFLPAQVTGFLPESSTVRIIVGLTFGLAIGIFSSVLGVAGGEVIIPTLIFAFGLDIKTAGTASLLVSLPTVLVGIGRYASRGAYGDRDALQKTVLPMAVGSLIGAALGGVLVGIVPANLLKIGLGVILLWSANRIFNRAH